MKELIEGVNKQISEAIEIGAMSKFNSSGKKFSCVLVCGLGGSGIGGKIVSQLVSDELKIPFLISNEYGIPACVNEHTLLIASSYSGNTEETIAAVKAAQKRNAEIVVIASGGELLEMAIEYKWNHLIVPKGQQPRAMLLYSLIQQLYALNKYGLISDNLLNNLPELPTFIGSVRNMIQDEAKRVAAFLHKHTPVIYAAAGFEGIAVRFRQQLNENAKMLCWHHVLPEMNHNELVGWAGGNEQLAVVYIKTDFDHPRTSYRWEICKEIIAAKTPAVTEIRAKGKTRLEQNIYLIHLTDWVSIMVAELKQVDSVEVNVISHLKSEMGKKP
ncbi:MAG: bifunctional phosphoglucose/phosphomannose isomerase [Crocinitomicaceae bacterium]|nr:bifunctional phosphoglucose/phosphomannose isomerase [Crocinitomicaceae bacterium]MBK8927867.1 bifunctional phosphoglucose/phosphomannose isomerase [Crocinitomicaceae bacterium]